MEVLENEIPSDLTINSKSLGFQFFLEEISVRLDSFQSNPDIRLPGEIGEKELHSYITKVFPKIELFCE